MKKPTKKRLPRKISKDQIRALDRRFDSAIAPTSKPRAFVPKFVQAEEEARRQAEDFDRVLRLL
jgi:hypothetical protein